MHDSAFSFVIKSTSFCPIEYKGQFCQQYCGRASMNHVDRILVYKATLFREEMLD